MSSEARLAVAVLAGGRSTRMGRDKALLPVEGRTLLARQVALGWAIGAAEVWVAGRAQADLGGADARGILDAVPGAGPLGGLAAVLEATQASHVLLLAVDLPALTPAFLARVVARRTEGVGVAPRTRSGWEPTAAVYPRELAPTARRALATGRTALHALVDEAVALKRMCAWPVDAVDEPLLVNWNRPGDWSA